MKYLALLRGINVGGNNKVEMSKLKKVFESLGYTDVATYINSGNVIFTSNSDNFSSVEPALEKAFGFKIKTIFHDAKNIQMICKKVPNEWVNNATQKTDVIFLWDEYDNKNSLKLIKTTPNVDTLLYVPGAIVWNLNREHIKQSSMHKFIGTDIYKNMTARNINTVRKLGLLLS
jgi:uncharacterized protein (DUF1697 family)